MRALIVPAMGDTAMLYASIHHPPLIGIFPSRSICSRFLHRVTIYFQYHRFSVTPPFVVNAAAMPRVSHTLPAKFERSYLGLMMFVISIIFGVILGVIFSYF